MTTMIETSAAMEGAVAKENGFRAIKMTDDDDGGADEMDESTQSLSSGGGSEVEEEDSSDEEEEEGDADEKEEDYDEEDYSSEDSSLGSTIAKLEAEAAAEGRLSPFAPASLGRRTRSRSMSNIMELDLSAKSNIGNFANPQQQSSFQSFMNRMNGTQAPSQVGQFDAHLRKRRSSGVALSGQGVASFGATTNQDTQKGTHIRSRSANELGDMIQAETSSTQKDSPNIQFQNLVQHIRGEDHYKEDWFTDSFWHSYFQPITPERTEHYTMETVRAMRAQDLPTLRQIYYNNSPDGANPMEACNRQGESLLHLACRRRNRELVQFLVDDCRVNVQVRDDWGKTPLHELCWNSQRPSQFQSALVLIHHAPELLVAKDKRGFLPLQYVPKDAWRDWSRFIDKNREDLEWKLELIDFERAKRRLRTTMELVGGDEGTGNRKSNRK